MKTALITGGSSGIGLEFAKLLAGAKYDLILVARDENNLQSVAKDLRDKFKIAVDYLAGDLADEKFATKVCARIRETENLRVLINDAGFGLHESLLDDSAATFAKQTAAFRVMAQNILEFSASAAQIMRPKNRGHIINIASTSAFTYQGNYSALKRWVVSYTEALALELRETGVSATAVCPGWAHTNFHKKVGLDEPSIPEFLFVKPETVAKVGLRDSRKGKILSIPTAKWKVIVWFLRHGPIGLSRAISRKYMSSKNYKHGR